MYAPQSVTCMSPRVTFRALRHAARGLTVASMAALTLALTLIVRMYDSGSLPDADRHVAIDVATQVLLAAEIPTTWPQCPAPRPTPRPAVAATQDAFTCDKPIAPGEVAVRFVLRSMQGHPTGSLPLGYSLVDARHHRGTLATIYLDRLDWVAADAGVPRGVLLGRAIAHEIGHLLLGTNAHAGSGLMRARWSRRTLEHGGPADWLFSTAEAVLMRSALAERTPVLTAADSRIGRFGVDGRTN